MKKVKDLLKNNFVKSVFIITGGTILAQAINTLLTPIITRMYTPGEFGILSVYTALIGMVSVIGALSYEHSIPIADNDEKAINSTVLCVIITTVITFILLLLLSILGERILGLFDAMVLLQYKYYIPLGFFTISLYSIFVKWSLRKKSFKTIAKTKLSQTIIGNTTKIIMGLMNIGPLGLIIGKILGESCGTTTLARPLFKKGEKLFKYINRKEILWCAKRYSDFPLYFAPGEFLNIIGSQLPVILISSLYNPEVVGYYGLAKSITFLPMTIIGKSIKDVFYGEVVGIGKNNPTELKRLIKNVINKLLLISIVPMAILLIFGPSLFAWFFGNAWYNAGIYSRLITIYVFTYFVLHPLSVLFTIFEQQKKSLIIDGIKLILVIVFFIIANFLNLDSYVTIFIYNIILTIIEFIRYTMIRNIIKKEIG